MDYFKEAVHAKEGERAWVTYIKAKVTEQNQSFPTLVVGQTGSGKSWSTLRLCQEIDPDFKLEGNWYFRAAEFFKDFTNYYKENTKKGKIWVLDEAGVDFSSDDWQSKSNKIFAKVFSTARFRNYIFFGTVPFTDFISKKIRKLMQYRMTANYTINKNGTTKGVIVPRCLQWNEKKEDFYYHKLVKLLDDGQEADINKILLPKPKKRLREEYEKVRKEFSDDLNDELLEQLGEAKESNIIPLQYEQVMDKIKEGKKQIEIAKSMEIGLQRVKDILLSLRKKGWDFSYNKRGNSIYNPEVKKWQLYQLKKE